MNNLWAPWRIEYVAQARKDGAGCFLCAAAQAGDERDALVLWRGESCLAVMNRWPYNNGHLMVAPLAHKGDMADLTDDELADQMAMLGRCRRALDAVLRPHGYNVGLNLGEAAGAGLLDHVHWHIVPRWVGDTNYMPVLADAKVIPQALDDLWRRLREADGRSRVPEQC